MLGELPWYTACRSVTLRLTPLVALNEVQVESDVRGIKLLCHLSTVPKIIIQKVWSFPFHLMVLKSMHRKKEIESYENTTESTYRVPESLHAMFGVPHLRDEKKS